MTISIVKCFSLSMRICKNFLGHTLFTFDDVHLFLQLGFVSRVPSLVRDTAFVKAKIHAVLVHFVRYRIFMLGTEWSNTFRTKVVLF